MRVKGFRANGVFGYLNFDIDFNEDVSFLVGGNGAGKTTALKLMNALVIPNFSDLLQIPFESVFLTLMDNKEEIVISANTLKDDISMSVSGLADPLILPNYSSTDIDYYSRRRGKHEELMEEISRKHVGHPIVRRIAEIQSPIFLGLDRRQEDSLKYTGHYYRERDAWIHQKNIESSHSRRLIKGSIGASLVETEMLVQNSYRQLREAENEHSSELRDSILLSAFQYSKFDSEGMLDIVEWREKPVLLQRQKEIKEALSNIGVNDTRLGEEVDKYFDEIAKLFDTLKNSTEGITLEFLVNKAQIERMSKVVEIIDEHKSKVDDLYKPINDFLSTVNNFYSDSNKKLEVDSVGQLFVRRPNESQCTIEGLSSGERQLLVIFAHSFFSHYGNTGTVFIIDEPELSLHLGWQEKFADTIFSINPDSQYILATHSPEIIGENKDKAVSCR